MSLHSESFCKNSSNSKTGLQLFAGFGKIQQPLCSSHLHCVRDFLKCMPRMSHIWWETAFHSGFLVALTYKKKMKKKMKTHSNSSSYCTSLSARLAVSESVNKWQNGFIKEVALAQRLAELDGECKVVSLYEAHINWEKLFEVKGQKWFPPENTAETPPGESSQPQISMKVQVGPSITKSVSSPPVFNSKCLPMVIEWYVLERYR